jgi:GntR family transcriptional regulator/MocR family aminotransferase
LILAGSLPVTQPLPSSRQLSCSLGVSRNTIVLIFDKLIDQGYLISKPRRGVFIAPQYHESELICTEVVRSSQKDAVNWNRRFRKTPSIDRNIVKPNDWQSFEYPFIYGQIQNEFFPMEQWRDCARKSLSGRSGKHWINDRVDSDDPMLIQQLRTRLLPRRGIYAEAGEILVTVGTQNSLYLLANLLCDRNTCVGLEDPGFRDAKNIFSTFDAKLHLQPVDQRGVIVDDALQVCDYLYVTPSHQVPSGVELGEERRKALLSMAEKRDFVVIEDDYDAEINMHQHPLPALKAMDKNNRVIYIGSMSKTISPGLRLGFIVADEELISELRALRRLMYRHPPANNQRQVALFLSLGYYDAYLRKTRELYATKLERMLTGVERYLPDMLDVPVNKGVTALWLAAPTGLDTEELSWRAAKNSILIEPGAIHFLHENPPNNFFRLGFSAIAAHKIIPGIEALAHTLDQY